MNNDYTAAIEQLRTFGEISIELEHAIRASFKTETLAPETFWLQPSQIANSVAFVAKGMLVAYHPEDQQEKSDKKTLTWLMPENNFVISVSSFFSQQPAEEYIKAVEPCTLHYVTYAQLQYLYDHFVEFNIIGRRITEHYYMLSEQRLAFLKHFSAEQRVAIFMDTQPELYRRITGKLVAEFLHISLAEFYRIRAKLNREKA